MGPPKQILVPTDFSQNSAHAVHYACDLLQPPASRLHLVHVGKEKGNSTANESALNKLAASIDAETELSTVTKKTVLFGMPANAIVEYARENDIDLIVMGTHGRTGLAHVTMGSVAEDVLRNSPCPVTVLGPRDGENATVGNAMEVVKQLIADGWTADRDEGHASMAKELVEKLRVPSMTAILMVSELEHRRWISWENGTWLAIEGDEWADTSEPFTINLKPESQAVELIKRALKLRSTDVHIDPIGDAEYLVRLRIDGQLNEYCRLDRTVGEHLVNQFKSMARVDIADPFHPTEGRVSLPASLAKIEVRLSSVPVSEGQAMALRILDPEKVMRPLGDLGFLKSDFVNVGKMLNSGEGLILVTGPTGSGKTTTVYSMLETIGGESRNIVSIEDPVEFTVPFVRQVGVDSKHDLNMSSGLRTLLRMDPDILFIGEIRDKDAGEIAMRAAASGKYVFSTLHTRDVAGTISSLDDLGLQRRSIAANLTGIINQRLIRKLCTKCREAIPVGGDMKAEYDELNLQLPDVLFEAKGCDSCSGRGYHGRIGVFETCVFDHSLRLAVSEGQSKSEIASRLKNAGIQSLRADALTKAASGEIGFRDANSIRWIA